MTSTQAYHDETYLREVWALFGVGMIVFTLRWFVRLRIVGLKNLAGDDYLSVLVCLLYLADALTV